MPPWLILSRPSGSATVTFFRLRPLATGVGSSRNSTLSYCRVRLPDTVRSSRQANASFRSSLGASGRCRSLASAGSLAKRAL